MQQALLKIKSLLERLDSGNLTIGDDIGNHQMPLEMLLGILKVYVYEGLGEDIPNPFKTPAYKACYKSEVQ